MQSLSSGYPAVIGTPCAPPASSPAPPPKRITVRLVVLIAVVATAHGYVVWLTS